MGASLPPDRDLGIFDLASHCGDRAPAPDPHGLEHRPPSDRQHLSGGDPKRVTGYPGNDLGLKLRLFGDALEDRRNRKPAQLSLELTTPVDRADQRPLGDLSRFDPVVKVLGS
jgi:hypothetical protein